MDSNTTSIKILLVSDDISVGDGAERMVANLANAFNECGYSIKIVSLHHKNKNLPFQLNPNIKIDFYEQPIWKYQIKQIKNIYKRYILKIEIILYKFKLLCLKFRLAKTDEILKYRLSNYVKNCNSDIVIDNTFYDYRPILKCKNTYHIMLMHICYSYKISYVKYEYFDNLKRYDLLIILSDRELSLWQTYHKNICVIPNFLPTIPQVTTNHSQKVVLSVGRISHDDQKGFLRLLDIWKMVRDNISSLRGEAEASVRSTDPHLQIHKSNLNEWKLIIVGDGVLKSEIESKIHALNLQDSVLLKPFTKDIESEYLSASIYAMTSHFEGFPMVLLESTSYGLAPISFDIATGPSDIIENNKSGFLVSDNDLQEYADKLIALMSDESTRVRFGNEAKKIVEQRFSKEVVLQKWCDLFLNAKIIP